MIGGGVGNGRRRRIYLYLIIYILNICIQPFVYNDIVGMHGRPICNGERTETKGVGEGGRGQCHGCE